MAGDNMKEELKKKTNLFLFSFLLSRLCIIE